MTKKLFKVSAVFVGFVFCLACRAINSRMSAAVPKREEIAIKYTNRAPIERGEHISGVVDKANTDEKLLVLTFDLCRGGYDEALINFLIEKQIPATVFMTGRWMHQNSECAAFLAKQSNFKTENHGFSHRPLCVNGCAAYGIEGTNNAGEAYDEVEKSVEMIQSLTGKSPVFFRSGTAFYDDVALDILKELGVRAADYTIAGDEGATLSKENILKKCTNPSNGAILLFHMNHPESDTGAAIEALIPTFLEKGFRFVHLEDVV